MLVELQQQLSGVEVGARLRTARESRGLTQLDAAKRISVARTTLVAMEQGRRRVRIGEIQALASLYGVSANSLLRQESVHLDLVARFRRLPGSSERGREEAVRLLDRLVSAELELENVLGVRRGRNDPPEQPLLPGDVAVQAEEDAHAIRAWIGLGDGPVLHVASLLELQLGARVHVRRIESGISGLFAHTEPAGACVLLNGRHPERRRAQTAARALGHLVAARREPEVLIEERGSSSREERYAAAFARSFLTPGRAVRRLFAEITAGCSHLTRRHVILLAHAFRVSREAMARRFEELGLARRGAWDWFEQNGGITDAQARQVVAHQYDEDGDSPAGESPAPQRLTLLAREAWKRDFYSEGQLAELLALDRHAVRELLDGAEQEMSEAADLVALSP